MKLAGKNILVAGGSSGIGLSVVKLLAALGAQVWAISRTASPEWPASVKYLPADITGELEPVIGFLPEKLDGLVYAVGSITLKPFTRLADDDFLNDYRVNVLGAARLIRYALGPLKKSGNASIVMMSSVAARTGMPYHASIAAAKAGVEGFALSLAAELATLNIRVNVIAPSLTETPLSQNLLSTPEKREASAKRHPLGRYGQAQDISEAVAFLLSESSSWMTGQVIGIDGGLGKLKTI